MALALYYLFHIVDGMELPIKFVSATLSEAERKYSQIEREALAIVFAFRKFHKFVYGRHVKLFSDHKPLEFIFGEKKVNTVSGARIQRWSLLLSQYDYKIIYRKASQMGNADGLSRLPIQKRTKISESFINFCSIVGVMPINQTRLAEATDKDNLLSLVKNYIKEDNWPKVFTSTLEKKLFNDKLHLSVNNGCLFLGNRLIIPGSCKLDILELLHKEHPGVVRMKSKARGTVWWPGIDRDIETYVKSCDPCQSIEGKGGKSGRISWPETNKPFERVHVDFFHLRGATFLIFYDTYSKWMQITEMKKTKAAEVVHTLKTIFSAFGLPDEIVLDNGPPFGSKIIKMFANANGIKLTNSPEYHPQSNGSAERAVQTAKQTLKKNVKRS